MPDPVQSSRATAGDFNHASRTIVVVDDDTAMREAITRTLDNAGFHARPFASAAELLQDGAASSAACLILDVHLPDQSGFDLQRQLTDAGIHSPVIFITAFDGPEARKQAQLAGAADFLPKPFGGRQLLAAVSGALRTH
ncbi:MAG TPA: response regulator [Steroidobacteraceae bacterium]|nr:response regulator [Steroidobacteraceae bacterium]